jgi:hypothetical protein
MRDFRDFVSVSRAASSILAVCKPASRFLGPLNHQIDPQCMLHEINTSEATVLTYVPPSRAASNGSTPSWRFTAFLLTRSKNHPYSFRYSSCWLLTGWTSVLRNRAALSIFADLYKWRAYMLYCEPWKEWVPKAVIRSRFLTIKSNLFIVIIRIYKCTSANI